MPRYTVTIVEVVETTYETEIVSDSPEQAKLLLEDLLVNYDEAAEEAIQTEKQLSHIATARLA